MTKTAKIDFQKALTDAIEAANKAGDEYIAENPKWQADLIGSCSVILKGKGNGLKAWLKKNLPAMGGNSDRVRHGLYIKYRGVQQVTLNCECASAFMFSLEKAGIEGLELKEYMN